jgi:catalase
VLTDQKREILINNIVAALAECRDKNIINRSLAVLSNVDEDLESKIKKNLQSYLY